MTWFARASRVRDGVARLDASLRYAEALATGERLNLRVAQLPYQPDDRWVGCRSRRASRCRTSRFSLVVQSAPTLDVHHPLAGLLIDEWVEVVPNARETTGIVFQYDQPDAAPPQSVLLAVPPDLGTAMEPLDAAAGAARDAGSGPASRRRSRDAGCELGHYLPALYFALNVAGETVRPTSPVELDAGEDTLHAIDHELDEARAAVPQRRHDTGLQARIYDPLWLLARQWQIGEFQGEDNGSPAIGAMARQAGRSAATAGGGAKGSRRRPGLRRPPRCRSRRGRARARAPRTDALERLRFAAEAGQHFLRMLEQQDVSRELRDPSRDVSVHAARPTPSAALDADTLGFLELMPRRVPDGARCT